MSTDNKDNPKSKSRKGFNSQVEKHFVAIVDKIGKENKRANKLPITYKQFSMEINVNEKFIAEIKRGQVLSVSLLANFCRHFGIDMNQFCYDDAPLNYEPKSKQLSGDNASGGSTIAKDGSTVNQNTGDVHIGNNIQKSPPELGKNIDTLVTQTRAIKKMDSLETGKVAELELENQRLQTKLTEVSLDLISTKQELIIFLKEKK